MAKTKVKKHARKRKLAFSPEMKAGYAREISIMEHEYFMDDAEIAKYLSERDGLNLRASDIKKMKK